ncbi:hypothetical protein [Burkholderia cenocepacia]|uniref:hypothetical protein n=1 Tax=Burkholderia cenocepacia TaxID=95486 RepID=UPI002AB75265|nr:hypothetical protein [Burkholderia cenocepacia]
MKRTQLWASGGGVQSAAIAALIVSGKIEKPDLACISDTGYEQSTTWEYMDTVIAPALQSVGVTLHRVKKSDYATVDLYGGKDGDTLLMPVFTDQSGEPGKLPGYCSSEWKRRVVQRWANAQGVTQCDMWLGISTDEMGRVTQTKGKWANRYPLIERFMNRGDCVALVERVMGWPTPPRSSCWNCPNHLAEEWRAIRSRPDEWQKVIHFDRDIRKRDPNAFLHHDCVPLEEADLDDMNGVLFGHECSSGLCFV